MDNSTENVTLIAAFVNDVLNIYKGKRRFEEKLSDMTKDLDLTEPMNMVPMKVYNDMIDWIEQDIGEINTKKVGRQIGETAYQSMLQMNLVKADCTPMEMMSALKQVAEMVIADPKGRGWEIIDSGDQHIVMRRTQTFNSTLQFGLLDELMKKTSGRGTKVSYEASVKMGAEFDDYRVVWV
ncbi:MAG: hypothetical protein AB8B73_02850 [Ekhidna sp.]